MDHRFPKCIFFLDISVWLLWYDLCLMAIVIEKDELLDDVHCWSTHFARKVSLVVLLKAMNYRKYCNVLSSSLTCRLNIYIYIEHLHLTFNIYIYIYIYILDERFILFNNFVLLQKIILGKVIA